MASAAFARIKAEVLELVGRVPAGKVTTHLAIAERLDVHARQVAFLLATLKGPEAEAVPWHRSVSATGSLGAHGKVAEQQRRLVAEGVEVTKDGVELARFFVEPGKAPRSARPHPARLGEPTPYAPPKRAARRRK
ncbi:MAG: MGMT family protein [Myxococcaceae bacterium]|nr:MGMT family protein [Myxococcaceae bacterium]